ncbi:MAG TPA: nitrous oxide reductase family maturation protein NosD [Gemmatimonadaceae bacterium]
MIRLVVLLVALAQAGHAQRSGHDVIVDPRGPIPTITGALANAAAGDRIIVRAGTYAEPTLLIRHAVTIIGDAGAVLDGQGQRTLMIVSGANVIVRGLTFRNTGSSQLEDRAALLVRETSHCRIERNTFEDTFFGIYLQRVSNCTIEGNRLSGAARRQTLGGNGIHVWQSDSVLVTDNVVRGHRDGVYFEFITNGVARGNVSEHNQRYGLHFMFSDDCLYERNTFQENESGVAVMYTRRVRMLGNTFARNWGAAAYGLLLKDIADSEIRDNRFIENTYGLYLEGASRNIVAGNTFASNGWGLRVLANAQDNRITDNVFTGNSFDVGTNSRQNFSTFSGNYWDRYRGYDLDRDGFGDVPHAPVRLFALVVEQTPPALILLRSAMVDLLDLAERVLPMLTPQTLIDERPRMKPAP